MSFPVGALPDSLDPHLKKVRKDINKRLAEHARDKQLWVQETMRGLEETNRDIVDRRSGKPQTRRDGRKADDPQAKPVTVILTTSDNLRLPFRSEAEAAEAFEINRKTLTKLLTTGELFRNGWRFIYTRPEDRLALKTMGDTTSSH
mmetsp:Transcript_14926/g.30150  ORF Transcript_14926/g.30150 Transcript_14926/m.30150 type:complete len:146 (-) Transcript_14926:1068-1505(-)